jgi:hypothetical protein
MGTAWERHGNGMGTAWEQHGNGMGTAWERYGMCESALIRQYDLGNYIIWDVRIVKTAHVNPLTPNDL